MVRIWPISRPTMRINAIHTIILACAYDTWWQPATPADAQNSIKGRTGAVVATRMQTFTCVNSALHAGHAGHATRAKSDFVKSTTRARIRREFTFSGLARPA